MEVGAGSRDGEMTHVESFKRDVYFPFSVSLPRAKIENSQNTDDADERKTHGIRSTALRFSSYQCLFRSSASSVFWLLPLLLLLQFRPNQPAISIADAELLNSAPPR
ncbi:hypothetical protein [Gemmatimonas sp.]|uniref:hypothetical protein n=1 Tax=Gemmatimonas sp. TaxID=1962908 RepID=UPI003566EDAD